MMKPQSLQLRNRERAYHRGPKDKTFESTLQVPSPYPSPSAGYLPIGHTCDIPAVSAPLLPLLTLPTGQKYDISTWSPPHSLPSGTAKDHLQ